MRSEPEKPMPDVLGTASQSVVQWLDDPLLETSPWKHQMQFDVQVFDTDCFGVMWHGAYTKWLEMGRVKMLSQYGIALSLPNDPEGFVYPVAEQTLRYRVPARYGEPLVLTTGLRIEGFKLVFTQVFRHAETGKLLMEAETMNLVVDMDWKLQRRLPAVITDKLGI